MSKKYESFEELFAAVETDIDFKEAHEALRFVTDLHRVMEQNGISQAELARRIGKSDAYVSKVLRGDTNFTLKTMIMLSEAAGGVYHQRVAQDHVDMRWLEVHRPAGKQTGGKDYRGGFKPLGTREGNSVDRSPAAA